MNAARKIAAELLGLFVEDWPFAIAIGVCIAIVAVDAAFHPAFNAARGALLFATLAIVLLASVARDSQKP